MPRWWCSTGRARPGGRLLSGDREAAVAEAARRLGIRHWRGGVTPAGKCAHLRGLVASGRQVLMIGDGLNDAPALAAATVSLSPTTALDISQTAADAVFQGASEAGARAAGRGRTGGRVVRQNFALAFAYNLVTVPLAIAGLVTPLIAAGSMSASSILVVGNALRLAGGRER